MARHLQHSLNADALVQEEAAKAKAAAGKAAAAKDSEASETVDPDQVTGAACCAGRTHVQHSDCLPRMSELDCSGQHCAALSWNILMWF